MRTSILFVALWVFALDIAAPSSLAEERASWKAGLAKTRITPDKPLWMGGFRARTNVSQGTLQELYAKALALDDGSHRPAVLMTADIVGFRAAVGKNVAERAEKQYGLPRARLILNFSHTHSGPLLADPLSIWYRWRLRAEQHRDVEDYTRELEDKVVAVVGAALRDLQRARLSFGCGEANFGVNRRRKAEKGGVVSFVPNPEGPVDSHVPVLRVDSEQGRLRGVVFGYACHTSTLLADNYRFCGDYAGLAEAWLEQQHPDAVAFFVQGCGADIMASPRGTVELARQYGETLGTCAAKVLDGTMRPVRGPLRCAFEVFPLAFAPPPSREELVARLQGQDTESRRQALEFLRASDADLRRHAQELLKILDGGGPLPTEYAYPLKGVNVTLKDYQNGPLENWTTGTLHFNGRDQYAVLSNEDNNRTVTMGGQRGTQQRTVSGADLRNPQIYTSNFLIEAYFKTAPGQTDATLIQKMDDAGYALRVNEAGGVTLAAQAVGAKASLASHGAVNNGQWHHVIAEADRKAGTFTIYINGKQDASGQGLGADASLANDADLYVGGTPQGHNLDGAIDFMRIARGTLTDAKTTIEELYAWEFNGPFLYDFTGRERLANGGEAAAIDDVALGHVRAATYVVDQAAPGAADTNPGTEEKPFKTVQHAADAAKPGDIVYVMAGKYDERVKVKAGGTEGKPVAFVAMPRRSATVAGFDLEASYIRVKGFEITADKPATAVQLRASHCEILDNYIHDMMVAVNGVVGKPSADGNTRDYSAVTHSRIAYNKVYHSEYGFILGGEDWLVENNEVSRLFMYAPGNRNDDCDYSRFFGKGCIQRYNYYHGTLTSEIKVAHVDCIQTFMNNGGMAQDLLFEFNTCFDWGQGAMVESAPYIGNVRNWTFRHNIYSSKLPTYKGAWGLDIIQTPDVTIENNTFAGITWCGVGLRGKESTNGQIRNNIFCEAQRAVVDGDSDFTPAKPVVEYNLTFKTAPLADEKNINGKDPMLVDAERRDFRLKKGSPAIGAGKGGMTIGVLEYPNVYYVDPRHPAAVDEPAWGYPAVPLASLDKACAIAQPGETIVLRGGVYREVLTPKNDGVTVRAIKGEKVTISGADLIEGWKREVDGSWSAPLAAEPKKLLRDGQPWSEFSYDKAAKRIMVKSGGDPRLHVFETVLREQGIDLVGKKDAKIEDITVVDTLKAGAANP